MLKESIYIKNFGPLKSIEIDEIKKINVFIGDSGSGKSTIMKVLVLFQWIYKQLCIRNYLKLSGVKENIKKLDFKDFLAYNGIYEYLKKDTEIIYKRGICEISYKNNRLNTNSVIKQTDLSFEKMAYISEKRNLIPGLITNPFSSNMISDFYLSETIRDFLIAANHLTEMEIPALNISLKKTHTRYGHSRLLISNKDAGYFLPLEHTSSGMQNVAPLYTIISYFASKYDMNESMKKTIKRYMFEADIIEQFSPKFNLREIKEHNIHLHIEEPELSLFPKGQIQLMEDLLNLCFSSSNKSQNNFSLIISTHSPYIMNYLNLVIKKGPLTFDEIGAYKVYDGEVFSLMKKNNQIVDTRSLSDPISDIYNSFNR